MSDTLGNKRPDGHPGFYGTGKCRLPRLIQVEPLVFSSL
jgi:hypothetical protein